MLNSGATAMSETEKVAPPARFTVRILDPVRGLRAVVEVSGGVALLRSLPNSTPVSIGCKGGGCGVCKVRVLDGEFSAKRMSKAHISDGERANNIVLACQITPLSDLTVEVVHSGVQGSKE